MTAMTATTPARAPLTHPLARLRPTAARPAPAVVLSYGLGVDSTAILLRWLLDPTSRGFDLADLVVVTAR